MVVRGFLILVFMLASGAAWSQELHLVQWKKTKQCEVIATLPLFGDQWEELGVYESRYLAERALRMARNTRRCPAPPEPTLPKE